MSNSMFKQIIINPPYYLNYINNNLLWNYKHAVISNMLTVVVTYLYWFQKFSNGFINVTWIFILKCADFAVYPK